MPKGGLLHCHLDATVNASFLLKLALDESAMHVRTAARLTSSSIGQILPEFQPLLSDAGNYKVFTSLWDEDYIPGSWVPIQQARNNFILELGGPEGFDEWVIASLTINPTEAYRTHNTVKKVSFPFL